ncbi:hypothetical protein CF326_g4636 [Tilletia indica]|nr:hypothetical protein CF326_g4636 [Tilletia indica]
MVLRGLLTPSLYQHFVFLPPRTDPVPDRIRYDPSLHPFFEDVVGAIDGSHVPAHAPLKIRDRFWNRKGATSFNILAVCDFDMKFNYILSGWEGSTSDSFLWKKGLEGGLRLQGNQKLLGDSGFPLSQKLLIPYRGVRYHLKEYAAGTKRPRNAKELYNRRHAGARSVIERSFGVIQARFKILTTGCHFDMQTQADLFSALAVVHNHIRTHDPDGDTDAQATVTTDAGEPDDAPIQAQSAETRAATAFRDQVSARMWKKYVRQKK